MSDQELEPSDKILLALADKVPLFGQALQAQQDDDPARARRLYLELMDRPDMTSICLHQLALLQEQRGDLASAIDMLKQAVQLDQKQPMFYEALSYVLHKAEKHEDAATVELTFASMLSSGSQHKAAIPIILRVLAFDKNHYQATRVLAATYLATNQLREAVTFAARALSLLAAVDYKAVECYDWMLPALKQVAPASTLVISDKPSGIAADLDLLLSTIGKLMTELGFSHEGDYCARRAYEINPTLVTNAWNMSLAYLRRGEFSEGWALYESRWNWPLFIDKLRKSMVPALSWGESLKGKTIGLYTEQGMGDALMASHLVWHMFNRFPELGVIVLEVPKDLVRLMKSTFYENRRVIVTQRKDFIGFVTPVPLDYLAPLMSVPDTMDMGGMEAWFDINHPLKADTDIINEWERVLDEHGGNHQPRVGLCWAGSAGFLDDSRRSLNLDTLIPLIQVAGVQFHSLTVRKPGTTPATDLNSAANAHIVDMTAGFTDYADTAAYIANLDLVITTDTSVAHLAAGMGKPTWLLLALGGDWRWGTPESPRTVYGSHVTIFRQVQAGGWANVVERTANALKTWEADWQPPVSGTLDS